MGPPVNSPGSSAVCITVFSEGTSKGLESGGGSEVQGKQRVSAWDRDVQKGGGALLDALAKESG